jgi:hypothetical protein
MAKSISYLREIVNPECVCCHTGNDIGIKVNTGTLIFTTDVPKIAPRPSGKALSNELAVRRKGERFLCLADDP